MTEKNMEILNFLFSIPNKIIQNMKQLRHDVWRHLMKHMLH